ncbi:guanine-specific ribonuclease N1 and T1 [Streptomyces triticagri]|uniref:Guanine-specific ribonuclease N1 and T1 n=1 Tax=Streptomyces triticagri TaxID=2293568 RepID=A0A372M0T6_9ACTN|nr:ribonuclease domain-containing protein [Streptomyces triticagri]RFU84220.1 guanine-specific ribonuclease N1 and T1 [Streptomyces triticagri]
MRHRYRTVQADGLPREPRRAAARPGPRTAWGRVPSLIAACLALLVAVLAAGCTAAGDEDGGRSAVTQEASSSAAPDAGARVPDWAEGFVTLTVGELPGEARETLRLIDSEGPFPYEKDGSRFGNFEGLLPEQRRGYYREFTVPTPGERDRGARRIVTGDGGEIYYTDDHYETFKAVLR